MENSSCVAHGKNYSNWRCQKWLAQFRSGFVLTSDVWLDQLRLISMESTYYLKAINTEIIKFSKGNICIILLMLVGLMSIFPIQDQINIWLYLNVFLYINMIQVMDAKYKLTSVIKDQRFIPKSVILHYTMWNC